MAVAPYRAGQAMGFLPNVASSVATVQTNAAANWAAFSFVADGGRTLSEMRVNASAVAGTLAGTDVVCDLYDSAGTNFAPGSSVETGKLPTATLTAAGWYSFTGFTTALTAGQMYWGVL